MQLIKNIFKKYLRNPFFKIIGIIRYSVRHFLYRFKFRSFGGLSLYRILKMYALGLINGAIAPRAESTAYSFFMATFPTVAFVFAVIPYIPIDGLQDKLMSIIENSVPPNTWDMIQITLYDLLSIKRGGLLSISFVGVIFFATNGIYSLFANFRTSYNKIDMRNIVAQWLVSLNLLFILLAIILSSLTLLVLSGIFWSKIEGVFVGIELSKIVTLGEYLLIAFSVLLVISLIFRYGPKNKGLSFFSPGAILSTILVFLASYLYAYYVTNIAQYNALYGSLGAILIFMFWLFTNSYLLLMGFELNAAIVKSAGHMKKKRKKLFLIRSKKLR